MSKTPKPVCAAQSPMDFGLRDWWDITRCVFKEIEIDNVAIIAAGVAFFTMLAIFPLITACLSLYGFFADPAEVETLMRQVSGVLPKEAWDILDTQITGVINTPNGSLGWRIVISLLIAVWSAGAGIRAIMRAMNVAYGEREKRKLPQFYAIALLLTVSVTFFMWAALAVIVGIPAILNFIHLGVAAERIAIYLPWIILVSIFAFATAVLYRIGPSRRQAKFRWVIPGVIFATLSWLAMSATFSGFVAEFSTYNKTYGGLSAAIILLVWFWLTAFVVIVGAELNAEIERHTSCDTTRGPDRPIGRRGAAMADYRHPDAVISAPSHTP